MRHTARTWSAKPADNTKASKKWRSVDATGAHLGKLAVKVANALRGKDKPTFTPHVDTGDFVVVYNAASVKLTGAKMDQKIYYRHSGYIGSLKSRTARELLEKEPETIIKQAVSGMLPKNKLAKDMIRKLKIYPGKEHPHTAQAPTPMEI